MEKKEITAQKSPKAIGPYSQAVQVGNVLYCSGQIGLDPKTNALVSGGIKRQTHRVFDNLQAILNVAGVGFESVAKVTVYLKNIDDFPKVNEIYATYFTKPYPARATVEVAKLPKGALIEVELIAYTRNAGGCCGGDCGCG